MAVSYNTWTPRSIRNHAHASPASSASAERAAERTGIESSSNNGVTSTAARSVLELFVTWSDELLDSGSSKGSISDFAKRIPGSKVTKRLNDASEEYGEMDDG